MATSSSGDITDSLPIIGQIVDYVTGEDKTKNIGRVQNSDKCWYPSTCSAITYLTPILATSPSTYSRETATADASAIVAAIFTEYRDQDLPQIYQSQNGSGGYNSTTAQLLANDAFARTVAKASNITVDTIVKYGNVRQGDVQALAQVYAATKGSFSVLNISSKSSGDMISGLGSLVGIFGSSL